MRLLRTVALLFCSSAAALACFQTDVQVGVLHGERVSGVITLDGRPIVEAKLELHSLTGDPVRDKKVLGITATDSEGAFDFGTQHPGGYMIEMASPSYEHIPVQLLVASRERSAEALAVRFTADYCLSIGTRSARSAKPVAR